MPGPKMQSLKPAEEILFSIRMPHIFLFCQYISFGHFTLKSEVYFVKAFFIDNAMAIERINCFLTGTLTGCSKTLNNRFLPLSDAHL